jgi:hypothetical protein
MSRVVRHLLVMLALLLGAATSALTQTANSVSGIVQDEKRSLSRPRPSRRLIIQTNFARAKVMSHFSSGRCHNY